MTSRVDEADNAGAGEVVALRPLEVPAALTVGDLASLMGVDPVEVIKELMRGGYMLTVNEVVDHEVAATVAASFSYDVLKQP